MSIHVKYYQEKRDTVLSVLKGGFWSVCASKTQCFRSRGNNDLTVYEKGSDELDNRCCFE